MVQHEVHALEERLAVYDSIFKMYQDQIDTSEDPRALFLSVATLEYGILSNQNTLKWLKSVIDRIMSGDYKLKDFQQS